MLNVLHITRTPKPWILSSLHHHHPHHRPFHHSATLALAAAASLPGAVSVWRADVSEIGDWRRDFLLPTAAAVVNQRGEGSWNVAWDARPARWTHRLDLAWLLFGVCAFLAPVDWNEFVRSQVGGSGDDVESKKIVAVESGVCHVKSRVVVDDDDGSVNYSVTGVVADGRCLFRAIAHGVCLRSGEEVPDENRQRELADELRARVVDELLKRREETEWFIEGDFDAYVQRIKQPFVWGGEPELLMASHVLKTTIAVYMRDKSSGSLTNIANYGEEYQKDKEFPINVLFHGYGHYELLEASSNQRCQNGKV